MNPSNQPEPKQPCPTCGTTIDYSKGEVGVCSDPHHFYGLPDAQADLLAFVTDPKTIAKAVEGSMDKRLAVEAKVGLREKIIELVSIYGGVSKGPTLTNGETADAIIALFQANKATAKQQVINDVYAMSPTILFKNWKPNDAAIFYKRLKVYETALARLQPPTALTDQERSEVSLCETCMSVTHTHDGVCTRCGELKAPTAGEGERV
jgi:hypothetical protein